MKVWKYPLPIADEIRIELPQDARPLTVQMQNGEPWLWVLLNPDLPIYVRTFVLAGTGHEIDQPGAYIGTFQMADGAFVFHLFEVTS